MREAITVIGASLAGLRGVETLRSDGFDGRITLVGDEPHQPYDRPPLSKQVLAGDWEPDRIHLAAPDRLADLQVDLRLGQRATGLDLEAHTVEVDGVAERFDGLLIATGAQCRALPGTGHLAGVHTLRTLDDCLAIRAALEGVPRRLVVVGAGFIGSEVASVAVDRGVEVTMVEALPVPLVRVLGAEIGTTMADLHRSHGVDLRCGVGVVELVGEDRVRAAMLDDGSVVEADMVVVGIGVVPNTDWLESSGLDLDDGVCCDVTCLAAPDVTAAGDVARWDHPRYGRSVRVEHWDNAVEQGIHAARRLLQTDEEATAYAPVPWFWSDQYDRKIQVAGLTHPDDEVRMVTGSPEEGRFAALYGSRGRFNAVFGMNRPRQVMQFKSLIDQEATWEEALAYARELG